MKYFFSFLFGAACGVGGTLIFLRKDIQKQLAEIKEQYEKNGKGPDAPVNAPDSNVIPFEVSDTAKATNATEANSEANKPIAVQEKTYTRYENLIRDNYGGEVQKPSKNMINSRKEERSDMEPVTNTKNDIYSNDFMHWEAIDDEEYDKNPEFDKDKLVFYAGDRVLSTENGTVIENGFLLIGNEWEEEVGHYADRTAFIRNHKSSVDYAIYVEAGCYSDEWGKEGAPLIED